jgi:hypothetical protein
LDETWAKRIAGGCIEQRTEKGSMNHLTLVVDSTVTKPVTTKPKRKAKNKVVAWHCSTRETSFGFVKDVWQVIYLFRKNTSPGFDFGSKKADLCNFS